MITPIHNENSESSMGGIHALGRVPVPDNFEAGVVVKTLMSVLPNTTAPSNFEQNVLKQIQTSNAFSVKKAFIYGTVAAVLIIGTWFVMSLNKQSTTIPVTQEQNISIPHVKEPTTTTHPNTSKTQISEKNVKKAVVVDTSKQVRNKQSQTIDKKHPEVISGVPISKEKLDEE